MEGVFYMQSPSFGRLCITQRIDLRGTYNCPKKGVHYNSIILTISVGVTTNGLTGKCLIFPVTR